MSSINFTKAIIDKLPIPEKGWTYYRDDKTPSLNIGVGSTGIKTFFLYKRINNKPERIKIGRYPETTIEQARNKAMELHGQIAKGKNPAELKRGKRDEMTLQELFGLYIERYAKPHGLKTLPDILANFDCYLGKLDTPRKKHGRERVKPEGAVDWSKRKISAITHQAVSNPC
jgi:hypothetical protein